MELADLSLPFLLFSILPLIFSLWFIQGRVRHSKSKLPPGPWTLPFIGSLHHLATAGLPHHALRNLAKLHGPVMLLRAGEIDLVVVTSREAAKEVMKTHDASLANRPVMCAPNILMYGSKGIAFSNGPYWRNMRRICTSELLSSKHVKFFSSIREEEFNAMLKSFTIIPNKSPVNLTAKMSEHTTNIIIRAAFGGKCKNRRPFVEIFNEASELLSTFNLSDFFPSLSWLDVNIRRLVRLHSKLDMVMESIIQEHLKKPRQQTGGEALEYDLVDVLINVRENGDLEESITMDNIKAVILDLLIGGTESSAVIITWAMAELIRKPEIMAKAQTEIRQAARGGTKIDQNGLGYVKLVIKETLRMHPPAPLLGPRVCQENCQILGYTIPTGARILVNAWALGRNPEYWEDPEEFKPERFETSAVDFNGQNFEFVPFGAGRRICPGIEFGIAILEEALARILLHFDWELPNGMKPENLDMTEKFGGATEKKEPLCLIPTLRVPLPEF
ncbi:Cytochrome P450 [Rhynchospora pubera]|uniref:Cytochrome P450 n=1 Tax=Rhynchospora pubera TaxID=906938 RepID=A0AAV8E7X1_9POAL|nr:Cytochrome P450 [Rhynchospora pubera]